MRSRAVRCFLGAVASAAFGAAAFFLAHSERQLATLNANTRAFDLRARDVTDQLSELRAAQQAYVAAGQGAAFWMPKVAETLDALGKNVASLRASAAGSAARTALDEAVTTLAGFSEVDRRARDYLALGQPLMAADVIFTEGGDTAAATTRQVEGARLAEHQARDAAEGAVRVKEALALAGAAGLAVVTMLVLALAPTGVPRSDRAPKAGGASADPSQSAQSPVPPRSARTALALKAAAEVCIDFGCVRDASDLRVALGRAGEAMEASGLIVWLGTAAGGDLQPVLAHGYADQLVARLPNIPRAANNAAAAAYRTGEVQIVLSKPGSAGGAVVAPIRSADGCIGALSAEIRDGGEASESAQTLAVIVAAQLAGMLSAPPADAAPRAAASS